MIIIPTKRQVELYLDNLVLDVYVNSNKRSIAKLGKAVNYFNNNGYQIIKYYETYKNLKMR